MSHHLKQTTQEWKELQRETPIQLHAASLSLNILFSLFPLLLVIVSLFGVLSAEPGRAQVMIDYVRPLVPPDVLNFIAEAFLAFLQDSSIGIFSIGFLLLLWSASRTVRGAARSLDRIYRNERRRHWAIRYGIALGSVVVFGVLFFVASNLLIWGDALMTWMVSRSYVSLELSSLLSNMRWLVFFLLSLGVLLVVYKFLPNHDVKTTWRHHAPGAVLATLAWILGSLLFNLYLTLISGFEVYGVIGIFIVLILYIQLVSYAFFVGAYLNSVWEGLRHRSWLGRAWEALRFH